MSQHETGDKTILMESPRAFFFDRMEQACKRLRFEPLPLSRQYLVELLEFFIFSSNLFRPEKETLAELYLKASNSPAPLRQDLLKKLGDGSLYISGFFGDSLNRKVVDLDYYVDMGGVAYGALAQSSSDEMKAKMYGDFASNFPTFVDVLAFISQESSIQTNGDLLKLYDRYIATGSRLAEERLVEKGLINADLPKVKTHKM